MDEEAFWSLIGVMDRHADEAACHRLFLALRRLQPSEIVAFQDRLGEVLHRMDLRSIAKQRWRDTQAPRWLPRVPGISADGFLYARCAAVAAGRATVDAVVADHRTFAQRWDLGGERLLYTAEDAYQGAAGRSWPEDHAEPFSYETGSNPDGGWKREGYPEGNPQ